MATLVYHKGPCLNINLITTKVVDHIRALGSRRKAAVRDGVDIHCSHTARRRVQHEKF